MTGQFGRKYSEQIEERVFKDAVALNASGSMIAGLFCAFTPKELVAAAGVIPVSLCAGTQKHIPDAEVFLPAGLCPLIKASFGNAVTDTCPYFHMTDFLLADATCDGKKKMFELMKSLRPITVLQLPQTSATEQSLDLWYGELIRLRGYLEAVVKNPVTDENLHEQICLYNRYRETVTNIYKMNTGEIPAFTGLELVRVTDPGGFECNLSVRIREMKAAMATARKRMTGSEHRRAMAGRPRILLTGCPTTNKKVLGLVEDCGGVVVAMETCGGLKTIGAFVDEKGDPLRAIANRYLKIPCACMTPNTDRADLIADLAEQFHVDGVMDLTWTACHTYNIESNLIEKAVTTKLGLPYLHIVTDYSENDSGQLETRIEAFFEIIA